MLLLYFIMLCEGRILMEWVGGGAVRVCVRHQMTESFGGDWRESSVRVWQIDVDLRRLTDGVRLVEGRSGGLAGEVRGTRRW